MKGEVGVFRLRERVFFFPNYFFPFIRDNNNNNIHPFTILLPFVVHSSEATEREREGARRERERERGGQNKIEVCVTKQKGLLFVLFSFREATFCFTSIRLLRWAATKEGNVYKRGNRGGGVYLGEGRGASAVTIFFKEVFEKKFIRKESKKGLPAICLCASKNKGQRRAEYFAVAFLF